MHPAEPHDISTDVFHGAVDGNAPALDSERVFFLFGADEELLAILFVDLVHEEGVEIEEVHFDARVLGVPVDLHDRLGKSAVIIFLLVRVDVAHVLFRAIRHIDLVGEPSSYQFVHHRFMPRGIHVNAESRSFQEDDWFCRKFDILRKRRQDDGRVANEKV